MKVSKVNENKSELVVAGEKINKGLTLFEDRKTILLALADEAKGLVINGVDDKEGLLKVSTVRKKLKAERVEIEKEGKLLRSHVTDIAKNISVKEKELIAITQPSEIELQEKEDAIATEKENIQLEKVRVEKLRVQVRIDKLADYGFSIDYTSITEINDLDFEEVLQNAKVEFEKDLADKAEEKRLLDLETEKLRLERVELADLREKQAAAQLIIDLNNRRLQQEMQEREDLVLAAAKKVEDDLLQIKIEKDNIEADRLHWIQIDKLKAETIENARLKFIEEAETERINNLKEIEDQKIEDERQLGLKPDKEKLQLFSDTLSTLKIPAVVNENSQLIVNEIQVMVNKMQGHIIKRIKGL